MQNSKNIVIALLVLSIPLMLGIYFANKSDPAASPELINASYLLNQQVAIADFNLIDQNEQVFTPRAGQGRMDLLVLWLHPLP